MKREEIKILENNFKGENLFIEKAKFYLKQESYDSAIEELKKAIEINPNNDLAHFEMGNVFVRIKDDARAEEEYKKSLELNPHLFEAAVELGRFYHYRQRRLDLAMESFKLALAEASGNWAVHYELGKVYKHKRQFSSAISVMKKASELNPEEIKVRFELGKLYRDLDSPDLAIAEFEKALSVGTNNNDIFIQNKALNEIEITEKKLVLESKVRAMVAMIINKCNVQCVMCNIWKSPWQASGKTMDEIVALFPYLEDIVWEGGEVFLMKGFESIVEEGTRFNNLKQVIFTNGLVINERIIEKLIHGKVDIVFSIEAANKETYEYIRKGGKFQRLLDNLRMVKEAKEKSGSRLETHFNSVIMKSNYREIEEMIDFAKSYNFNAITLTPIRGDFKEENIFENNDKEALEYINKSIPKIIKKAYEAGIILNNWLPGLENERSGPTVVKEGCGASDSERVNFCMDNRIICYAPWQRLVIDNEGQVRPFVFCLNQWVGNTNQSSLDEIWNSSAMQEYRRRLIDHNYRGLCQPECISGQVAEKIRDVT